ncbi:hypothetical protein DH2020_034752 [Rehmannia glutinosa]|uniref:KOW domain-containing protein n=1 Tax=Rehmannia glutinosa TaxID=99300 RepID=A0ABR0V994_REHGL
MPRRRDEYEEDDEQDEEEYDAVDEEDEEDYDDGGKTKRKRGRSDFIDDYAEEDDEERRTTTTEDYGGGASARGGSGIGRQRRSSLMRKRLWIVTRMKRRREGKTVRYDRYFIDTGADIPDEDDRRIHRRPLLPREASKKMLKKLREEFKKRYAKSLNVEYDEEATDVEQQALLPSVRDPKLWMVKCAIGREREVAVCLMQKSIDKGPEMQIRSAVKVESKAIDISRDTWVRMKIGIYKGDLAKVVGVDNVRQRATVKLIPRIDLQALANKLEGSSKEKAFTPPARFMNIDEARELHIRVERRARSSNCTQNVQPTFDELEKFRHPGETGDGEMSSLTTLFANRKKGHFMKGDRKTLAISDKELCKYFEPGNHVKVVSGATEGATGMVVSVEAPCLCDNVVESSEVTSGVTRIGDYELHDLVLLDDNSFGVIIRVESEAFQVLKGVPDRPDVALFMRVKNDLVLWMDVMLTGLLFCPMSGKQGPVEHIYKGVLFIYDRHHLEHAGFICVKSESCMMVGGSRANGDRNGNAMTSRFSHLRTPPRVPQSPMRPPRGGPMNLFHYIVLNWIVGGRHGGGRGHDALVGAVVKIRLGHYKGCKGRVKDVKGAMVRIRVRVANEGCCRQVPLLWQNSFRETSRYGMGSETPMHPSRTPLHPYMTPMRDSFATPHHDGMRTPMRDRAWNPYTPMSPPRDNWEDANPLLGEPVHNISNYEAGTPRDSSSAYANAPSPYLPSTPGGQPPMTPSSAYLPGTPGGQPMTPGSGGLDMMSPVVGADNEGPWLLPDILVSVRRSGEESATGVIKEVLPLLDQAETVKAVTALQSEIEIVAPRKAEKIKIMGGAHRGATGKLIGIGGTDGIVKVDDTLGVKILDMVILAKLVQT